MLLVENLIPMILLILLLLLILGGITKIKHVLSAASGFVGLTQGKHYSDVSCLSASVVGGCHGAENYKFLGGSIPPLPANSII